MKLNLSQQAFLQMLPIFIQKGCGFEGKEESDGTITITFTGSY